MRLQRLIRRSRYAMLTSCLMMAAFYVGRLTVRVRFIELILCAAWVAHSLLWFLWVRAGTRRDDQEFRNSMSHLAEEMRGRFNG